MSYLRGEPRRGRVDLEEERLEEFHFLFDRLAQTAQGEHPSTQALVEYVRGLRPEGIDPRGWEAHAISAHAALCPECSRRLRWIRRRERLRALWPDPVRSLRQLLGEERWRRAYQYLGLLLLVGGIFLAYSLWQGSMVEPPPNDQPPPPAGEHIGDSPGVG